MRVSRFALSLLIVVAAMATLFAQPRPAAKPAAATSTTATTSTQSAEPTMQQSLQEILEEPTAPDAYHYDPKGRRDPFQSLIGPAPTLQPGQRPAGPAGFLIDEIKLQRPHAQHRFSRRGRQPDRRCSARYQFNDGERLL